MKTTVRCAFFLILVSMFPIRARAWNKTGHFVVASIAYDQLTPNTKMRVDTILVQHPDFAKWPQGVPTAQKGKMAFVKASGWPDDIKSDSRFFDPGDPPTPQIPGLPPDSNKRNREWYFTNIPFTMDNTPTIPPAATNVLTRLQDFQSIGTFQIQMQVFVLPWLIHLVGDVHQPLHTLALFREDLPNGDRGGGDIEMKGGGKLHSFLDGRVGSSTSDAFIAQTVTTITIRHPKPAQISIDPAVWVEDSVNQRFFVYSFIGRGTHQDQAADSDNYAVNAKLLAFERAALAGYRLAEFLNRELQ
jgi:S1/P1 Nuclease